VDSGLDDFDLAIVAIMPKKEARHLTKRISMALILLWLRMPKKEARRLTIWTRA
jgi:hypothetical protein